MRCRYGKIDSKYFQTHLPFTNFIMLYISFKMYKIAILPIDQHSKGLNSIENQSYCSSWVKISITAAPKSEQSKTFPEEVNENKTNNEIQIKK